MITWIFPLLHRVSDHYVLPTNHVNFSFCFPWRCFSSSFKFWFSFQILVKRMSNWNLLFQFLFCSHLNVQPSTIFYWISSYMLCVLLIYIKGGSKLKLLNMQGGARNFYFRGSSCSTNIFIKTTSHMHIYTCFFIIYTFFYLISYIYIHTPKKKKKSA